MESPFPVAHHERLSNIGLNGLKRCYACQPIGLISKIIIIVNNNILHGVDVG